MVVLNLRRENRVLGQEDDGERLWSFPSDNDDDDDDGELMPFGGFFWRFFG